MKTPMTRAELVRRLRPGVKLRLVWRNTDGPKNQFRTVISATTYSVLMRAPEYPRGESRIQLRDAHVFETDNGFEVHWPSKPGQCDLVILRYEWLTDVSERRRPEQMQLKGASS